MSRRRVATARSTATSQGNLHLLEVLVDGLGSLDGVLQLAYKLFRVGRRHELSPQSSLRLGPTHVVALRRCVKPPCGREVVEVRCGALHLIFGGNLMLLEVVVHQTLPLEILLRFLSPIERNRVVDVEVVVARGSHGLELGELLLSIVLRCLLAKMPYVCRRR